MAPALAPAEAWTAVLRRPHRPRTCRTGCSCAAPRVMGAYRVELTGFTDGMVDRLKAMGLVSEIIAWKLRLFVPTGAERSRDPRRADGALSARPHRGPGGGVRRRPCPSPAADLAHRLARNAEAVCRHYLSNGRRQGRYWLVGDVANTPGRSLYVRLSGPDSGKGAAGKWTDAATGEHGDLLDLIAAQPRP